MRVKSTILKLIITLILAILLSVILLPHWLEYFRPQWVLLLLVYWALYADNKVGVGIAWFLGLLLDLLSGSILCEHALGLVIISYIAIVFQRQIRMFPVWQQAGVVFVFTLIYLGLIFWIQSIASSAPSLGMFWMTSITTAVFWPLVVKVLNTRQQRLDTL